MDSLIATFHIDVKLMIAQLVNFAIIFVVLYFFAVKPLMKIMKNRTETIEKGLADAKSSAQKLEKSEKEYKSMLIQARLESQEVIKQARQEAQEQASKQILQAKEEVNKIVTQGKNQLAQEKVQMISEAKAEVVDLVALTVNKILAEAIDEKLDAKVINKIISAKE